MEFLIFIWFVWIIILFLVIIYNRIITLRNKREQSFADIDVQLKLRFDLIPNLMNTVKGYMTHEKEVLENVTKARTSFLDSWSVDSKIESENMLSWALKNLFAVAESYPDLKANQNFMQLQSELSDIENKIASARRFFNSTTQEYNTYIQQVPNNLIAWMFWFKEEIMFTIENKEEKEPVKVSF